jgi:hypothetical protein
MKYSQIDEDGAAIGDTLGCRLQWLPAQNRLWSAPNDSPKGEAEDDGYANRQRHSRGRGSRRAGDRHGGGRVAGLRRAAIAVSSAISSVQQHQMPLFLGLFDLLDGQCHGVLSTRAPDDVYRLSAVALDQAGTEGYVVFLTGVSQVGDWPRDACAVCGDVHLVFL